MWTCLSCEASAAGLAVKRAGRCALICSWCADQLAKRGAGFCRKCQQARPLPFGTAHHGTWCVACDKKYMHAKYERNKEARAVYQRAYQERNRDAEIERHRAYKQANRLQINARKRRYDAEHRAEKKEADRRWRARHPSYNRIQSARWRAAHPEHAKLARARKKLAILWGRR